MDPSRSPDRLDSWKAIAEYLQRDVATVRRWEALGLPIRRVPGGRGRSVFAYVSEIDAWLKTSHATSDAPPAVRRIWQRWLAVPVAIALVAVAVWITGVGRLRAGDLRIETNTDGVVAFDGDGNQRWRHAFSGDYRTALSSVGQGSRAIVVDGNDPSVLVATSHRLRLSDDVVESGALMALDFAGNLRRTFSFTDELRFGDTTYGPPWAITTFAIDKTGGTRRIAVAAHHYLWDPSVITVLDERWERLGTFAHAGWIEAAHWLAPDRLFIGGFSHSKDGAMVALLDPRALDGQGPEPTGTRYHCDTCGSGAPLRMIVMPRTELNLVTASRFNRAVVEVTANRIIARTIEIPGDEPADALYEFNPSLDVISASFSDRYWDVHRALEADGKLDHPRERCPDRNGPRQVQAWEPGSGWRVVTIASAARQTSPRR